MKLIPILCATAAALIAPTATTQDPAGQEPGIPDCSDEKTTESGLRYGVIKAAEQNGAHPVGSDVVRVHYTGWLTDGTVFDSSRQRGEPATFPLNGVIKGWTEGLQLMSKGDRFKLTIPADLGYGPQARGKIPADATLVFDVELLEIVPMPTFRAATADKQKATQSGIRYEYLKAGDGAMATGDDGVDLAWALFTTEGELVQCTEMLEALKRPGSHYTGAIASLPWKYMQEIVPLMKLGDRLRLEVPPDLCFGPRAMAPNLPANSTTVWEIELTKLHAVPKFALSHPEKMVTTETGLKYEVIKEGEGKSPAATNTVVAHYTGWLTDGTVFDSSHSRGEPSEFPLNRVIPGWTEGLQKMKEGSIYKFTIPGELAYGARGSPPKIGPNQTLVFLVELISIK